MAKNNNKNTKKNVIKNDNKEKKYVNPGSTKWGKVIIFILAIAMCLGGLASVIYLIVQNVLR